MKRQQPYQLPEAVVGRLLTVKDVKKRLGLRHRKLVTLHRNEGMPVIRLDENSLRVPENAFNEWLEDHREVIDRLKKELYPRTTPERAKRAWPSATSRTKPEQEAKKVQAEVIVSPLLGTKDICRILQCGKQTVYKIGHNGELPIVKYGRSIKVRPEALQRWIDERESWL